MLKGKLQKLALLVTVPLSCAMGQFVQATVESPNTPPNAHAAQVLDNTELIKLELTVDRDVYFRGEAIRVKTAVWNPTNGALEIFDPAKETVLDPMHWKEGLWGPVENYRELEPESPSLWPVPWDAPTVTLGRGERIEKALVYDHFYPSGIQDSDRFMLCYGYYGMLGHCAQAAFRIVEPTVVQIAETQLHHGTHEVPVRHTSAMLLEYEGKRYVVVSRSWNGISGEVLGPDQKLDTRIAGHVGPYDRVAEVSTEVRSIHLEADPEDNLTVSWQEGSGPIQAARVARDRSAIQQIQ